MRPYYQHAGITIYHGDCRDLLGLLPKVDVIFADPPYGVDKAAWDSAFTLDWLRGAATISDAMAITPGISNLLSLPRSIEEQVYRWTLSVRIVNAIVRGAIGFGNWIPIVLYARPTKSVYACEQDATEIAISGLMPEHPSPKPIAAMKWIVSRLPLGKICDPFCGSGTTLLAAKQLGREAIGIEIEEKYCEIAAKRLSQEVLQFSEAK